MSAPSRPHRHRRRHRHRYRGGAGTAARPVPPAALLAGLLALAGLTACHDRVSPPPSPEVVAEVDGEPVLYADFEAYVAGALGESGTSLGSDVLSGLFDQFLEETLLLRLAADRGVLPEDAGTGRFARRRAVDRLLAAAGLGGEGDEGEPTEAEVVAWYAAHRDRFRRPERVRLRQLLVEDRATAVEALAEIRGGGDFAAVARRLSDAPGGEGIAGFRGELARDDVPPAFVEVVFSLEPGEVSDVVEAEYGYHLFQVTERLTAEVLPLTAVRDEVEREMALERADRTLEKLVEEARRRYDVAVWERNLPFAYRGDHLDEGN